LTDRLRVAARALVIRRRGRRFVSSSFAGLRFGPDVVLLAVRWCLRYGLSYRDVEEPLAERGSAPGVSPEVGEQRRAMVNGFAGTAADTDRSRQLNAGWGVWLAPGDRARVVARHSGNRVTATTIRARTAG